METYAALDDPMTPRRFAASGPVAMIGESFLRQKTPREALEFHRYLIAFNSRFDSMVAPSMRARLTVPWEWTGAR
jgi:hypothetical protein